MRTHHALQPRSPEQASYSIGRRDGKQFLKLYRSYLHGTLAGTRIYTPCCLSTEADWHYRTLSSPPLMWVDCVQNKKAWLL